MSATSPASALRRDHSAPGAAPTPPDDLVATSIYQQTALQQGWINHSGDVDAITLIVRGMTCSACAWSIEKKLMMMDGVVEATVNYAAQTLTVSWRSAQVQLQHIIDLIRELGFDALPCDPNLKQNIIHEERRDLLRRFGVALAFGMQVMVLTAALYFGAFGDMSTGTRSLLQHFSLLLTLPIVFYCAQPFFSSGIRSLRIGRPNMDSAVGLAVALAFTASAWNTLIHGEDTYFESVVMFVALLLGTRFLESTIRLRANQYVEALATATPRMARRARDNGIEPVAAYLLAPGDEIVVAPGDALAADGVIVDGESSIDESVLTGESMPRRRRPGDNVIAGSVNVEAPLRVRVSRAGEHTLLGDVHRLVTRVQGYKPRLNSVADRISAWFVGAVLVLAVVTAAIWYVTNPERWLAVTIAVLAVACPCALSLATPAALASALGRFVKNAMLPTTGDAIEKLAVVDAVLFDKTGTLTSGSPQVAQVSTWGSKSAQQCLAIAAAIECHSNHPIAKAMVTAADGLPLDACTQMTSESGCGVSGVVDGERYFVGSQRYVNCHAGLAIDGLEGGADCTVQLASRHERLASFVIRDVIRPAARETVSQLRHLGKQVMLVSGDAVAPAEHVAARVGIDQVRAQNLPSDKLAFIRQLQAQGLRVAMIGDGVNDSPALAAADVSFAIGNTNELAIKSADIVMLDDNLTRIPQAVALAARTRRVIYQNLTWALAYNAVSIPAAAFGWVPPWAAALGMSVSSLIVVGNALRLQRSTRAAALAPGTQQLSTRPNATSCGCH